MPVHNADVAAIFEEMADLLDIEGANPFRVRAYRNAARTIDQLSQPVADMVRAGRDLSELPDIGTDLAGKIEEIVKTGKLKQLEALEKQTAPQLADLLRIPGLGPKRVRALHEALDITTRDDLRAAAQAGRIRHVSGFGATLEQNILDRLGDADEERRWLLASVEPVARSLAAHLEAHGVAETVTVAGSYRRRKETVGDLDVLVQSTDGPTITDHFVAYEDVDTVAQQGTTRASVVLRTGLQVDLRVVPAESYGAALHYLTGSKAHNVALRDRAIERGLKLNEYGVFRASEKEEQVAGATEEEVYGVFDLPYIVPELREMRGELEAASRGALPDLITYDDLRGNLHTHTTDSDGRASIRAMAEAAKERGLDYLAITDHSPHVTVAHGLDADGLRRQMETIDALNDEMEGIWILKSIEVDILEDGALDLPDEVLHDLDLRICAIHSQLNLSEDRQTERVLRAMDNPYFNILAHPTARRINERSPIALDLDRVLEAALERGCFLELNAHPERLDLRDVHCKRAKEIGVLLSVGADAHAPGGLDDLQFGIDQARRGWLEASDVLNTKPWDQMADLFDR